MRVYVAGRVCVEDGERLVDERALPGRQGRLVVAFLVAERARQVPRDELADLLWPSGLPRSWETALSALLSKARTALGSSVDLETAFGCHRLVLPPGTWVDIEAAVASLDRAEGAWRAGDLDGAWSGATVASAVARRPFLAGEEGEWVEARRRRLGDVLVRSLDVLADVWNQRGDFALAAKVAEEALALEPFRESGYRRLMQARLGAGDRAEALRVYERCRRLLADELGADPSSETAAMYERALQS